MIQSRLSRSAERKLTKKLFLAITGSIGLVIFIAVFGLKILINFSLLVDKIRGNTEKNITSTSSLILPPTLDPLPYATNSAVLSISGRGKNGLGVIVFLNGKEYRKLKIEDNGTFSVRDITFKEGLNTLHAQLFDVQGNRSGISATESVTITKKQPVLEISSPNNNDTITGDNNIIVITGKTNEENTVTVNDRIAVVGVNGIFMLRYPLNEGDNTLIITASDPAGNQKKEERKIKYQK
jgi:bacillopeptidase F